LALECVLAYLVVVMNFLKYITEGHEHTETLIPLLIFTAIFYFVLHGLEQVCIVLVLVRLQSVLLDNRSIVVAYDYKRGGQENGRKKIQEK
jgi:polyferredoxin